MFKVLITCVVLALVSENEAARILAYYPVPSISHQVVFRPLTLELAKKGHQVVVFTPDPIFPKGGGPPNLTEIDFHDLSYSLWRTWLEQNLNSKLERNQFNEVMKLIAMLVEKQMETDAAQKILNDKSLKFDLVITEAVVDMALGLGHKYDAPIIQFSSFAATSTTLNIYGAPTHPIVYPGPLNEKVYNMTALDKINEVYENYRYEQIFHENSELFDSVLKRIYGPDIPPYSELRKNVDMLFLNAHSLWDFNRPVPPNVIYLGGLHQTPQKDLPEDLQKYLDSSKNGVIYVSFGTNVDPALFPPVIIQALVNVFSKQPYDVLWKWNQDELPGRTENIRISKWLPQSDLLRHPKVKLFVTQGGLQSTDEALTAGVPLIGVPVFGDQKFNVEQYIHYGIGERVELETITEEELSSAINKVIQSGSYRENIVKLRTLMNDQPMTPIQKAVWWTEYVIRHKGAKHLRSPAANLTIAEYYELELIGYLVFGLVLALSAVLYSLYFVYSIFVSSNKKLKGD